ncbi:MAG: histidine phosphatase family protein [Myxococcales bacterium]|nr:histidine phosphatase family protein [Myxococcales bacterium]
MILLIRHGETALNAARVVQPPETPLSERGRAQAAALGARLESLGIVRIVSSDLRRAAMTAGALAAASGAPIEHQPLLQERNFGDMRGKSYSELPRSFFDRDYHPPGGESYVQFDARVVEAWRWVVEIAAATEGPLAVVTHGLFCHSAARQCFALEAAQVPMRFGNTSLTEVQRQPPHEVRVLNSTEHLVGELADDRHSASGL